MATEAQNLQKILKEQEKERQETLAKILREEERLKKIVEEN